MSKLYSIPDDDNQYQRISAAVAFDRQARSDKRFSQNALSSWAADYSRKETLRLLEANPYSARIWMECLVEAIGDDLLDAAGITVINGRWNVDRSLLEDMKEPWVWFDHTRNDAETYLRSRLRGYDFLLKFALGLIQVNNRHSQFVCLHAHGLVWGRDKKLDRRVAQMELGLLGLPGGVLEDGPTDSWIKYIVNDPRSKTKRVIGAWGKLRSWKRDDYLTRKELIVLLDAAGDRQKPDLCIGSGRGSRILKKATQLASWRGYQFEG